MTSNHSSQLSGTGRRDSVFIVAGIVWVVIYWIALSFLRNPQTSGPLKVAMVLSPAIPFAVFLFRFIGYVRGLDELHRRVHLEALALAFPIATLFLMTLGLIERAGMLSAKHWSYGNVWYYLPLFYLIAVAVSWRRYR
ncbi:MAG: hypothetical protein V7609_2927 [Verrucomicrobiota bacterium]